MSRKYELEMKAEPSLAKVICLEVAGVYRRHAAATDAHLLTQLVVQVEARIMLGPTDNVCCHSQQVPHQQC